MSKPASQPRAVLLTLAVVAAITATYYLLPVPALTRARPWEIFFWCGVAVLGVLILAAVQRLLRAGEAARARGLIVLLCLTVLFFAYADRWLAELPGQFGSLQTKTDALYFNVSTVATVGFGDVHASGQLARMAVTIQIVFNLVILGTAVGLISGVMRARAQRRLAVRGAGQPDEPGDDHRAGPA